MIKILFYDGCLKGRNIEMKYRIDADRGYKDNIECFYNIIKRHEERQGKEDLAIITNQIALLNTECSFDSDGNCQVYFWSKTQEKWLNAQDLTDKALRKGHNIEMMYRNGVFDEVR
jgi:hypothetical protein